MRRHPHWSGIRPVVGPRRMAVVHELDVWYTPIVVDDGRPPRRLDVTKFNASSALVVGVARAGIDAWAGVGHARQHADALAARRLV